MILSFNKHLILFISVLCAGNLQADSEDNSQPDHENVVITVASRSEQAAEDLPLTISVVTSEELDLIGHTHIQETLNRIPGVNLHRGNGQEYLPSIRSQVFTGAGACGSLLILEDNIPVRPHGLCNIKENNIYNE